jgi:hypothetical protein
MGQPTLDSNQVPLLGAYYPIYPEYSPPLCVKNQTHILHYSTRYDRCVILPATHLSKLFFQLATHLSHLSISSKAGFHFYGLMNRLIFMFFPRRAIESWLMDAGWASWNNVEILTEVQSVEDVIKRVVG